MEIQGVRIRLVPIEYGKRDEFFDLATKSVGSEKWYGKNKPSRKEFFKDWAEVYFDESRPMDGQCFWIEVSGKKIGQVNYNQIDEANKKVELDIVIGETENMGKGYGTEVLRTITKYLFDNFEVNKVWIAARATNPRAVRAYEKAGFIREGTLRQDEWFDGEFVDTLRFGILREG